MNRPKAHPDFRRLRLLRPVLWRPLLPLMNAVLGAMVRNRSGGNAAREMTAAGGQGFPVPVTIFRPQGLPTPAPCLAYFHGGAFVLRAAPHHYRLAQSLAESARCAVVLPEYRLAPRHPFPAALEDCYAIYEWAHANASALGVDPARVAVGGDSAGGNLAAAVCLLARDRGAPRPCFQMLLYPVTDRRMQTDSMAQFRRAPVWNARLNRGMWHAYLRGGETLPAEYASPAEAASHAGLPDAYVEAAELDPLRDEGIAYARALEKGGAAVRLRVVPGACHGFDRVRKSETVAACMRARAAALRE
ncbi:MAG TPA: alpha/beta hydrolase, partial [Candidatus Limnocylindria bacterium]|nr:alpha/beta hydrolase [Candidatus Limnocylindria bacterium]